MAAASRILPQAQAILIDRAGRATVQFYDFLRRVAGAAQLTPEVIAQIQELLQKIEEIEAGAFIPITASVIGEQSIFSQGSLAAGQAVQLYLRNDTSDQRATWYYGSGPDSVKGWYRFYTGLGAGAGILQRNSGYIELGEVDNPADLPPTGNVGEAYWVRGIADVTESGLWAWDGAAWVLDPAATGIVSFEVANGDYGDITVTGDGATWTIDQNAVTDAKLRDSAALSVIGRASGSAGDPADIAAANDGEILRRYGNAVGFGSTISATTTWDDNAEVRLGTGGDLRLRHDGTNSEIRNDTGYLGVNIGSAEAARFDDDATAGNTRFWVYDVDNATLERVSVGAADSGGVGFKVLRIPN